MEKDNSGKPKPTILTCAQPTGVLTIGNYLGAVRNWSEMLDQNDCYFGIVDLRAITTPSEPAILRQNVYQCVAQYIACGIDVNPGVFCSMTYIAAPMITTTAPLQEDAIDAGLGYVNVCSKRRITATRARAHA